MLYKVGDIVTVRNDLINNKHYGALAFVEPMEKHLGKQFTIKAARENRYELEEDKEFWFWNDDMFEPTEIVTKGIAKQDANKLEWDLLPIEPLQEIIKVLMYGNTKYETKDNWKTVQPYDVRYYNALMRHITEWKQGEKLDKESNLNHLAHASACILFMLWNELQNVTEG